MDDYYKTNIERKANIKMLERKIKKSKIQRLF